MQDLPNKSKHLAFVFRGHSESGKTKMWEVYNTTTSKVIGMIHWAGNFRKYTYLPMQGTYYDAQCLDSISAFLKEEMSKRNQQAG